MAVAGEAAGAVTVLGGLAVGGAGIEAAEVAAEACPGAAAVTVTEGAGTGSGTSPVVAAVAAGRLAGSALPGPSPSIRLPTSALPASAGMATATQPESEVPASASSGTKAILRTIMLPSLSRTVRNSIFLS